MPVSGLVTVTVAPESTAPFLSMAVPRIDPVESWAIAAQERAISKMPTAMLFFARLSSKACRIFISLFFLLGDAPLERSDDSVVLLHYCMALVLFRSASQR